MDLLEEIKRHIIEGDGDKVKELVQRAVNEKMKIKKILNEGMIPAMDVVGERYERGEIYIPEMLIAADAMYEGLDIIRPFFAESGIEPQAKAVFGTVKGDMHDIGKSLVAMMMEGAGFEVIDLGADVASEQFVKAVRKEGAELVCMSALLTTTMLAMKDTIDSLKEAGLRDKVKVLIGGAPVTQGFADEIGADGYAPDAASGVRKAKELSQALAIRNEFSMQGIKRR